jgi:hypothetical protein
MQGAPVPTRFVVYACYCVTAITLTVLAEPPYSDLKEIVLTIAAMAFLITAMVLVYKQYQLLSAHPDDGQHPPPGHSPDAYEPRPLTHPQFDKLKAFLADAREKVFVNLQRLDAGLTDDDVRANIFVPCYLRDGDPSDFVLKIYPGLHLKMNDQREIGIPFRSGVGVTGKVYDTGIRRVAQRFPEAKGGGWESTYQITDELDAVIHKGLKWILSVPLKNVSGTVVGVLNVDGLRRQFSQDTLYDCMATQVENTAIVASSEVWG